MPDKTIQNLEEEVKELGLEPSTLEEETQEAPLSDDDDTEAELDKPAESEEKSEDEESKTPPKVPDIVRQKSQERAQRRALKMRNLEDKVTGVESKIDKIVTLLESGKPIEAQDKFDEYAQKYNLDPKGIKELAELIGQKKEEAKEPIKPNLVWDEEMQDYVEEESVVWDDAEQKEIFDNEWDEILPKIEERYPHASASQVREAQKFMDELAHQSPQLADYDLEDIFDSPKYAQQFKDILFSPKKKTFESGRNAERGTLEEEVDFDNFTPDSPAKAQKMKEALYRATGGEEVIMKTARGESKTI